MSEFEAVQIANKESMASTDKTLWWYQRDQQDENLKVRPLVLILIVISFSMNGYGVYTVTRHLWGSWKSISTRNSFQ